MKVKITYVNESVVLDIPSKKFIVLHDEWRAKDRITRKDMFTTSSVRLIEAESEEDEVEIRMDEGVAGFFYDPVIVSKEPNPYSPGETLLSVGTYVYVALRELHNDRAHRVLEEKYTREEGNFTILTTPRVLLQVIKHDDFSADGGNFRAFADCGSFICSASLRLSTKEMVDAIFEYLDKPREEGKDYTMHTPIEPHKMAAKRLKRDKQWQVPVYQDAPGYWENVLLWSINCKD